MRNRLFMRMAVALTVLFSYTSLLPQSPPTLSEVKKSLICLCECNMTVEACEGAMACQSAEKLTTEAQQLIGRGLNKEQVLASFVSRYGEHILAAPTKKGFNLAAWILPFAAILVSGFVIIIALRRWVRLPQKVDEISERKVAKRRDSRYEKELDDILRALDR